MMDPLALSMRQRDCIFAFQNRRGNQQTEWTYGVALATNCLGDNLQVCVCGFDERVQRQVERSFCLATSVAFAGNARYYAWNCRPRSNVGGAWACVPNPMHPCRLVMISIRQSDRRK